MKAKTYKSAKKRVMRVTKNGVILRRTLSGQHLTHGKKKRVLRASNKQSTIAKSDSRKIKNLILK
jgi:ribosomal protein L35